MDMDPLNGSQTTDDDPAQERVIGQLAWRPGDSGAGGGVLEWHSYKRVPAGGTLLNEYPFIKLSKRSTHHVGALVALLCDQLRTGLAEVLRRARGGTGSRVEDVNPFERELYRVLSAWSGC